MAWASCSPSKRRRRRRNCCPPGWDSDCWAATCVPCAGPGRTASADAAAAAPPSAAAAAAPRRTGRRSSEGLSKLDLRGGASWWAPDRRTWAARPAACAQSR